MRIAAFIACAVLLAAPATALAQSVRAGIEAWQRSDYEAAVKIWRPLAEAGDADAAFNLAQAYRLGRGVPINLAAAQSWLERAADKNHVDAQTTLGLLLFEGGNRVSGLRWLRRAAEAGEPRAMLVYGTALFNGDGTVRDPVLAYAYVSRAAAEGLATAKTTLADLDKMMPLADRKKGLAIAMEKTKAKAAEAPRAAAAKPPSKPPARASAKAQPKPGPQPRPAAASGAWRIQLGAFSQRSSAEALYKKLAGRDALAGREMILVPAGRVTRLQVGPYPSRSAAAAACAALKGQPCFPVAAK